MRHLPFQKYRQKLNPTSFYPALANSRRAALAFAFVLFCMFGIEPANAEPPALREQFSLNGNWEIGGQVPVYGGEAVAQKSYERTVMVPAAWHNKIVRIEFESANHVADISINGRKVLHHVGGWLPFTVDITNKVKPGENFQLRVEVYGTSHPEIVDADGYKLRPIANSPAAQKTGLTDDVWLRAYGEIGIEDTFIQPSWREKRVSVEYAIRNTTKHSRSITIRGDVLLPKGTVSEVTSAANVTIDAGATKTVLLTFSAEKLSPWWPTDPQLYHLRTQVIDQGQSIDVETRRFGYREVWIDGNQFRLNGVRLNLHGDYAAYDPIRERHWPKEMLTREGLHGAYAAFKSLNLRYLRWHMIPAPRFAYEMADEIGVLLMAETAIYGQPNPQLNPMPQAKRRTYVENTKEWLGPWVRSRRNYASNILWGGVNESGPNYVKHHHEGLTKEEIQEVEAEVRKHDATRVIVHSGNGDLGTDTVSLHYTFPGGWQEDKGSVRSWDKLLRTDKPVGVGEFFQTRTGAGPKDWSPQRRDALQEDHKWWQGVWIRGVREIGLTDVRSKIFLWAHSELDSKRASLVRNGFSPVAIFDRDYDSLGIAPHREDKLPVFHAGDRVTRTLCLFNDEFVDENIIVDLEVRSGNLKVASGRHESQVILGEKRLLECEFEVPHHAIFELVRVASKHGREVFRESFSFRADNIVDDRTSAREILIRDASPSSFR